MQMLFACFFIELGTSLLGVLLVYRRRTKLSVLEEFRRMLITMKSRIAYGAASLEEIFLSLYGKGKEEMNPFYENLIHGLQDKDSVNFSLIWRKSIQTQRSAWFLSQEEEEKLEELGEQLGGMDRKEQLEQIELSLETLQFWIQREREGQASYQRFILSFSALAGLLIIVLIL